MQAHELLTLGQLQHCVISDMKSENRGEETASKIIKCVYVVLKDEDKGRGSTSLLGM